MGRGKLAKTVERYEESFSAQGRMQAIAAAGPKIQAIEEKSYSVDLTIKEAKVDLKAVKADEIKQDAEFRKLMMEVQAQAMDHIRANLKTMAEDAAKDAVTAAVTGGKS